MKEQSANSKSKSSSNSEPSKTIKPNSYGSIIAIVAVIIIALLAAIFYWGSDHDSGSISDEETEEIINANCTASKCLEQIEITDSPEKITEVTGVEPEVDEASGKYKWKLSSKESLAREKSSGTDSYTLQATIDKSSIASDRVDFSSFTGLKKMLESGESFTYEELVKKLGDVEGTLAGKTSTSERYIWVNNHDQTFGATFSDTNDGKCSIISLR